MYIPLRLWFHVILPMRKLEIYIHTYTPVTKNMNKVKVTKGKNYVYIYLHACLLILKKKKIKFKFWCETLYVYWQSRKLHPKKDLRFRTPKNIVRPSIIIIQDDAKKCTISSFRFWRLAFKIAITRNIIVHKL